ncbi:MAG: DUF6502 family protein [Pseudomonadota bacterium]
MNPLQIAATRILGPLVRVLISRGVRFSEFNDWAKGVYLAVAERSFRLEEKRVTDSRLHLLTGLQRKDIKALRGRTPEETAPSAGPLARIIGRWMAEHAKAGEPLPLPRLGPAPSFEALVSAISRDMHPRTVQDELLRLGAAELDGDDIRLTAAALLPSADDEALLGYLGANLGDHAAAAAANVLAAPDAGPHFERAVHYNHLSDAALAELEALSRDRLGKALAEINTQAAALQARDRGTEGASGRFRAGAFIYKAGRDET